MSAEESKTKFAPRPARADEAGLFYALPPEQDAALGAIGHYPKQIIIREEFH